MLNRCNTNVLLKKIEEEILASKDNADGAKVQLDSFYWNSYQDSMRFKKKIM